MLFFEERNLYLHLTLIRYRNPNSLCKCWFCRMRRCFVKYLLIDGADSIVANRLLDAGWPLTVENIWKYKQDIIRSHLYAGLAPLPEEVSEAKRKV